MNAGMKMLLVENARKGGSGGGGRGGQGGRGGSGGRSEMEMRNEMRGARNEMEMGYGEMGYGGMEMGEMEARRRRDRRGRFRSGMGEMEGGEMRGEGGSMEMRGDQMRGNYGEMRGEGGGMRNEMRGNYGGESHYPFGPIPPIYERGAEMNRIGFSMDREVGNGYRADAAYNAMNEMEHRTSSQIHGGAKGSSMELTHEMADSWMKGLQNGDGTKGPHWTMEQAKQVIAQRGLKGDPIEWWAVLNMMYSDYCTVFKKHNVNNMDIYVDMAKAFTEDKDASKGKVAKYFQYIVSG